MKKMTMSEVMYTLVTNNLDEKVSWGVYEPKHLFITCKECGGIVVEFKGDTCTYNVILEHDCFLEHAWSKPNFRKCAYMCEDEYCVCGDLVRYSYLKDNIRFDPDDKTSKDILRALIAKQEELLARDTIKVR